MASTLTTTPKYFIEDGGSDPFLRHRASSGRPSTGQERILDVKQTASAVAETEAKRRGWAAWQVDYIFEKNQGWMHVVKVVVVPKNAVEYKGDKP